MTITHINAVFYTGNNPLLTFFTTLGATICFSIFLFTSSYAIGLGFSKDKAITLKKTMRRVFQIYLVYLVLAILIEFSLTTDLTISKILNITTLNYLPEFSEFLIAFITFALLSYIFQKQIKLLIKKPLLLLSISVIVYIIGNTLHAITSLHTYPDIVRIIFENLFGYKDLHRFPIFQYLPIYSLGLILSTNKKYTKYILITTTILLISSLFLNLSGWYRWPPSMEFLSYGAIYLSSLLIINNKYKLPSISIGQYPLEQFFISTLLIFSLRIFLPPSGSVYLTILINIIIISLLFAHPIVFHRKMV